MPTHILNPLRGKAIRVTKLDSCGRYIPGASASMLATDGFVSISLSAETEDGSEFMSRKANGSFCVNERTSPAFKNFGVELNFCGVNPALMSLVTNATPYSDYAGDLAGFTVPEGDINKWFAIELWTGLANTACAAGSAEASGYILLPFVQAGVLGDIEINGEDTVDFSMSEAFTKGNNSWGTGPYNVVYNQSGVASKLPTALSPYDHLLMMDTGLATPVLSSDLQPIPVIPAPSWAATKAYPVGATVTNGTGTLQATTAGTSGSTAPTNPAVGATVTDGTVTWKRIA